jgi:hypothetical protein
MARMADHAKTPVPHKDMLLWVLYLIGACCLLEVSPAWAKVAADCAFLPAGPVPTDWTLPVVIEAYWGAALYGWLHDPAGQRSRRFAAASAVVIFLLSLSGQVAVHLFLAAHGAVPPPALTAFAAALPVLVLGSGAVLVHMRRADRARAEATVAAEDLARLEARADAEAADERTALRAGLDTLAAEVGPLRDALATAQQEAAQANAKAESLAAKLAVRKPNGTRAKAPNAGRAKAPNAVPNGKAHAAPNGTPNAVPNGAPETEVPADFDARAEALEAWLANPQITGKDLGALVGLGERWGQLRKTEFVNASAGTARSDERS